MQLQPLYTEGLIGNHYNIKKQHNTSKKTNYNKNESNDLSYLRSLAQNLCGEADKFEGLVLEPAGHYVTERAVGILVQWPDMSGLPYKLQY